MRLRIKRTKRRMYNDITFTIGLLKRERGSGYRTVMIILPYKITILRYIRGA